MTAEKTGLYELTFDGVGEYETKLDIISGGTCSIRYSADGRVR